VELLTRVGQSQPKEITGFQCVVAEVTFPDEDRVLPRAEARHDGVGRGRGAAHAVHFYMRSEAVCLDDRREGRWVNGVHRFHLRSQVGDAFQEWRAGGNARHRRELGRRTLRVGPG
jgi:hypothetical protein